MLEMIMKFGNIGGIADRMTGEKGFPRLMLSVLLPEITGM